MRNSNPIGRYDEASLEAREIIENEVINEELRQLKNELQNLDKELKEHGKLAGFYEKDDNLSSVLNDLNETDETLNNDEASNEELTTPALNSATEDGGTDQNKRQHPNHNKDLGIRGESAAACFLEKRGYEVMERNWRCPAGEVDIIARDDDGSIVFVEVKTRSGVERGFPAEAVTPARRKRYEKIAGYYLSDHIFEDVRVRFDIIGILTMAAQHRAYIRHHIDAFGVNA